MNKILTTLAFGNEIKDVDPSKTEDNLTQAIGNIISGVIGLLGLACVVIIIVGGIQYMTSSGDSGKVKKAKDTILYGVIGMVICILAFAITQFIITTLNNSGA